MDLFLHFLKNPVSSSLSTGASSEKLKSSAMLDERLLSHVEVTNLFLWLCTQLMTLSPASKNMWKAMSWSRAGAGAGGG